LKIKIYKAIILSVVLCDYEASPLKSREERGLGGFEIRILGEYLDPIRIRIGSGVASQ
jgi:hypothetical protein